MSRDRRKKNRTRHHSRKSRRAKNGTGLERDSHNEYRRKEALERAPRRLNLLVSVDTITVTLPVNVRRFRVVQCCFAALAGVVALWLPISAMTPSLWLQLDSEAIKGVEALVHATTFVVAVAVLVLGVAFGWLWLKGYLQRTGRASSDRMAVTAAGVMVLALSSLGLLWLGSAVPLMVFMGVASSVTVALSQMYRGARLKITSSSLNVDQLLRRKIVIPLEEVSGVVTDDGLPRLKRREKKPIPLSGFLSRRERIWLRRLLKVHTEQRRGQLRLEGHDPDDVAPPRALQAMRDGVGGRPQSGSEM